MMDTQKYGYVRREFEARLAMGEIKLQSRDRGAKNYLLTLRKNAFALGLTLISKKAEESAQTFLAKR